VTPTEPSAPAQTTSAVPIASSGPTASRTEKPTGVIPARKYRIRTVLIACLAPVAMLVFNKPPKKKPSPQQQEQQQVTQIATDGVERQTPDYSARVDATLSERAREAEENERSGRPPALSPTTDGRPLPTGLAQPHVANPATANDAGLRAGVTRDTGNNQQQPMSRRDELNNTIANDITKRDYQARFAPLVVMSTRGAFEKNSQRQTASPQPPRTTTATPPTAGSPAAFRPQPIAPPPSIGQSYPLSPTEAPPPDSRPSHPVSTPQPGRDRALLQNAFNNAAGPLHKLFEGTIIETVLTNRLNGTYSGPVNCMVTITVWSQSREHVLIPQGARILGEARRVNALGQQRLSVAFHRIIMPDGYSVSLDNFTGLNEIGETGLKDKVDNHYRQIFGVSIALGAIAGLSQGGANYGATTSGLDTWRQGFSQEVSREATQILDRYLNILPTVVIREGHRVKVYLTADLLLPAYEDHTMSTDL